MLRLQQTEAGMVMNVAREKFMECSKQLALHWEANKGTRGKYEDTVARKSCCKPSQSGVTLGLSKRFDYAATATGKLQSPGHTTMPMFFLDHAQLFHLLQFCAQMVVN